MTKSEEDKPVYDPPKEVNAWMWGYRVPNNEEFPEWKYGLRYLYLDLK